MHVCTDCFEDEDLQDLIAGEAVAQQCDFCGARADQAIAAPLQAIADHIRYYLEMEYTDPVNVLPWAEGQYWGIMWDTEDLLDEIGLELPRDEDGRLREALVRAIDDSDWPRSWTERDPFGLPEQEQLRINWSSFAKFVMHERRFFFRKTDLPQPEYPDPDQLTPDDLLSRITQRAQDVGIIGRLRAGTRIYRARYQTEGDDHGTAEALGPAPVNSAKQNRMSPAGIPMFHASEDLETAVAEVSAGSGDYAVGEFVTTRDAWILDLHDVPHVPGYFGGAESWTRRALIFLREFAKEVSKPIARDGREHIEYVPTQVLTEYFRTQVTVESEKIEGISFTSSQTGRRNYTLFLGSTEMVDGLLRFERRTVVRQP